MTSPQAAQPCYAEVWRPLSPRFGQAAQLTRPGPDGPEPIDFADFLTSALRQVAADHCGVRRLIAGRPGSWEAALVAPLAATTWQDRP